MKEYVGWYRSWRGDRWHEVCRSATEYECWTDLSAKAPQEAHRDLLVLEAGKDPNHREATPVFF